MYMCLRQSVRDVEQTDLVCSAIIFFIQCMVNNNVRYCVTQLINQFETRVSGFEQFCLSQDSGKKIAIIPGSRDFP